MNVLAIYTIVHVVISLVAIATGLVVVYGMMTGRRLDRWTPWFLWTTVATSVTGYGFPVAQLLPSHIVGAISLAVLAVAIYALYSRRLEGAWRPIYAVSAVIALYLNVFVLIVQLFLKVPALHALAPTQAEPPFATSQLAVLILFVALGVIATRRFIPVASSTGRRS
jgi:hypothetical protein